MLFIGTEVQIGPLIASVIMLLPITRKFFRSGIPRMRVIFLSFLFLFIWICSYSLTFLERGSVYAMLWEVISFIGMVGTLFILFIGIYEILANPGSKSKYT